MRLPRASYAELHLHTNYSLLDGASHPQELVDQAARLGYSSLAITDHNNLFGAMVFALACREQGIQPITGLELTLAEDPEQRPRHHLTLLAQTREGYGNLCQLASLANGLGLPTQAEREQRRLDPCLSLSQLASHCRGLFCLTGCAQGEVPAAIAQGDIESGSRVLQRWMDWFGPDNVLVELQSNLVHGDRGRNRALLTLARRLGVKVVASGNVHYHVRERHRLQDALVAIRHRSTLEASHQFRRPNDQWFLRAPAQQLQRFAEIPEAITVTLTLAERCQFDVSGNLGYRLPQPPVPDGHTPQSWLSQLCQAQLEQRYQGQERLEAAARLAEELTLIEQHDLAGFFLVYHQVLELAQEVAAEVRQDTARAHLNLPPGRGRGSSVGSMVCYLIGLSHIDPIKNRLFLGRFLNEEMPSLPDIDLDFSREVREPLLEQVHQRWGPDHAALVATFPRYRIRSAIRDLGKVLGLPASELDRLARLSHGYGSSQRLREEMIAAQQFAPLVDAPGWRELIELAGEISDFPRHLSQHVGGMVIASGPLVECVPVQPAAWPHRYVCHWDKDTVEDAGMVKIDFLGLGMLSLVENCLDLIAEHNGKRVDLSRIDFADQKVFSRIQQGDTIGVFQIESRAQSQMIVRTRPETLEDLTVQVALVRPGPIVGGAVNPYVRRRQARPKDKPFQVQVDHPRLEPVLKETLGVIVFQEQVAQVAMALAGFSAGRAEELRRAMARHEWPRLQARYRAEFLAGTDQLGVTRPVAEKTFETLSAFSGFGFPKSHAAAFGLLAYQSAWLKEHHPPEFYCALYNTWPMGFYPPHVFTNDARRHGVEVLRPHVNHSQAGCTVEESKVRIGLGYVKGVGAQVAQQVASERMGREDFHSLFDFLQRTGVGREAAQNLIQVGAFAGFGLNHRELLWQLGLLLPLGRTRPHLERRQLQLSLPTAQDQISMTAPDASDLMQADYSILGLSPQSHPMSFLRSKLPGVISASQLGAMDAGRMVETAGLVVCRQQPGTAKGTIFWLLEDESGLSNITITPDLYERKRVAIRTASFLQVRGRLEGHAGSVALLRAIDIQAIVDDYDPMPAGKNWS